MCGEMTNSNNTGRCMSLKKGLHIFGMVVIGVVFAGLFALLFSFVVKELWNWLMPSIFGLGLITYWQAFGIIILAKLLFGGFGPHHSKDPTHKKMDDKWHHMMGMKNNSYYGDNCCNSKYYKQFWEEEGKAAFESYINKMNEK